MHGIDYEQRMNVGQQHGANRSIIVRASGAQPRGSQNRPDHDRVSADLHRLRGCHR
jgi:hypothetical protein